jgi:hypothetical protein
MNILIFVEFLCSDPLNSFFPWYPPQTFIFFFVSHTFLHVVKLRFVLVYNEKQYLQDELGHIPHNIN